MIKFEQRILGDGGFKLIHEGGGLDHHHHIMVRVLEEQEMTKNCAEGDARGLTAAYDETKTPEPAIRNDNETRPT